MKGRKGSQGLYLVLFEQLEVPEGMDGSSENIKSQVIFLKHKATYITTQDV